MHKVFLIYDILGNIYLSFTEVNLSLITETIGCDILEQLNSNNVQHFFFSFDEIGFYDWNSIHQPVLKTSYR